MALTDIGSSDGGTMIVPGSHKANLPHPALTDYSTPMDSVEGVVEVQLDKGDALLFCDGLARGASSRTPPASGA